jgi:hypothetical protein
VKYKVISLKGLDTLPVPGWRDNNRNSADWRCKAYNEGLTPSMNEPRPIGYPCDGHEWLVTFDEEERNELGDVSP